MTWQVQFGILPAVQNPGVILIVFDNRLLGRKGATVLVDSQAPVGNMVADNLLSENRHAFWQSDSVLTRSMAPTPEMRIIFPLGSSRTLNWVSHYWDNILLPWRADLYLGDPDAGGTLLHTTDWMHPVVHSSTEDFEYDDFPWMLQPTDERLLEMAADFRMQSFAHFAPVSGVDHVLFRIDCEDGVNGVSDVIQVSNFTAATAFQPFFQVDLGVRGKPKDRSLRKRTAGGMETGISRRIGVELQFSLPNLTDTEGLLTIFTDWLRREPSLARVFVYLETELEKRLHFYDGFAFVGTLTQMDGIGVDEQPGEMGEILASKAAKTIKIEETE